MPTKLFVELLVITSGLAYVSMTIAWIRTVRESRLAGFTPKHIPRHMFVAGVYVGAQVTGFITGPMWHIASVTLVINTLVTVSSLMAVSEQNMAKGLPTRPATLPKAKTVPTRTRWTYASPDHDCPECGTEDGRGQPGPHHASHCSGNR